MDIDELVRHQAGVISRRQAIDAGLRDHQIRRLLRRNEWARVHAGVYIDHTGPLTWLQRAWAAVLYAAPAALCLESALSIEGPLIHIAVSRHRAMLVEPEGVRIHHIDHLDGRVLWNVGPPRLRYEEAALDVAARATGFDAIAVLADACQSRRTTADRLLRVFDSRRRIRGRRWLRAVLVDIAEGTCSVLEYGYRNRIERAHGLPRAKRQTRFVSSLGVVYRDAEYAERLVVELDGRLFHDSASARNKDFERDLDAAVDGRSTVRLGYRQVFDRPCQTAAKIAQVMRQHGIDVSGHACGPACGYTRLDLAA
ncbi:type IV toxin-antitoxin system AbiEi family antitoxin domain-containing protein [Mycolicibacterium sp. lyk4-40-TYG-92]|uniref:type IV toxin-antitoxin system AbiEi family antitoxin domain-containing protein n=1 Tax=Mycolicibacterium sp. lyk4-40-TYG-92 TaxID=3040295 RepID=UPI00254E9999|nr:type IV toxin-antitoxin system AbiEi family antitoxin domain-containing protein [Mycolicibacterium sp. lyk4-40-TYG-92]